MKILLNICLVVLGVVLVFYVFPLARFHYTYVTPMMKVYREISYKPDPEGIELFQSPELTERSGYGDCDDYCILLQERLWQKGHETQMVGYKEKGKDVRHYVLVFGNSVLDPTYGKVYPLNEYEKTHYVFRRPPRETIKRLSVNER